MRSLLNDASLGHDDNVISSFNGGKPVSDCDGCSPFCCSVKSSLDNAFRFGIQRGRSLVQQENLRV